MITTIMSIAFTILLIYLTVKLLGLAYKNKWGFIKSILVVAVVPCILGGLYIINVWYVSLPAVILLILAVKLGKIK